MTFLGIKKAIVTFSLILAVTLGSAPKAHAIVGLFSWNPPLIGAGLLVMTGAALIGGSSAELAVAAFEDNHGVLIKTGGVVMGAVAVLGAVAEFFGVIVLEDGSTTMEFSPVSPGDFLRLSITQEEAETYNSELDQINFITQQVTADLNQIEKPTVADSANAFKKYKSLLSPESYKVMAKISAKMFEKN